MDNNFARTGKKYGEVRVLNKYAPVGPGMIALEIVARWGSVAATDGGEDSSGRSKLRLQTPEELVTRGVSTAKLLWAAFEAEGWLLEIPEGADVPEEVLTK